MRKKLQTAWKYLKWAYSFYYNSLKDLYLLILTWLKRENSVGRYVEIATKTEQDMYCSGAWAGGMCYRVLIKLFLFKEYFSNEDKDVVEKLTYMILEHETLHMTLRNRIGFRAYRKLDNIHIPIFVNNQWILDWDAYSCKRLIN